jgi:hypothetical protein
MDSTQIIDQLKGCVPALLTDRPVLLAYAYGSQAVGVATPKSDVDIALLLQPDADLTTYERIQLECDIELEIEAHCDVTLPDVRSINHAPLRIQGKIVTQGVLLYSADEDARVAYELRIRKRYFDFQPVLTKMRDAYFANLKKANEAR